MAKQPLQHARAALAVLVEPGLAAEVSSAASILAAGEVPAAAFFEALGAAVAP